VLEHLDLREVGQEAGSEPPFVLVAAKSPERDAWRDTLLLPGGDCPIAILINTWDRGPLALVHEAFLNLDPSHQAFVRRHAALAARGKSRNDISTALGRGRGRQYADMVEDVRRRMASVLDPSVLLSADGSIRVQVGSVSETTRNLLWEGL